LYSSHVARGSAGSVVAHAPDAGGGTFRRRRLGSDEAGSQRVSAERPFVPGIGVVYGVQPRDPSRPQSDVAARVVRGSPACASGRPWPRDRDLFGRARIIVRAGAGRAIEMGRHAESIGDRGHSHLTRQSATALGRDGPALGEPDEVGADPPKTGSRRHVVGRGV
jgi:hypothetical protein